MVDEMRRLVKDLAADLRRLGDPDRAGKEKAYLKSELRHFGVRLPDVREAVRERVCRRTDLRRSDLLMLVRTLWTQPVHELRSAAVESSISPHSLSR